METNRLSSYVPLATAVGVIASISFVSGYFQPVGQEWIATLSLADLLAVSWGLLPLVIISTGAGALISYFTPQRSPSAQNEQAEPSPRHRKPGKVIIACIIVMVLPSAIKYLPAANAGAAPLVVIAFIVLCFAHIARNEEGRRAVEGLTYVACIGAVALAFALGFSTSGARLTGGPKDQILLEGGRKLCGIVLVSGERGVIYFDPKAAQTTFVDGGKVEMVIKSDKICAVKG